MYVKLVDEKAFKVNYFQNISDAQLLVWQSIKTVFGKVYLICDFARGC